MSATNTASFPRMTPANLPTPISGPSVWVARDLAQDQRAWLHTLSNAEIAELEAAAEHFAALGKDLGQITTADFPLPHFAHHLTALQDKLLSGNGIEVMRGLPTHTFDQRKAATIFCGIGAHLGSARSQNAKGHILGHVRDTGVSSTSAQVRIYQTAERQTFHTDSADVVGLLCLNEAKEGGDSLLVSAATLYNRMYADAPELLCHLFDPIATDRRGEVPEGAKPFMQIPPLSWYAGKLTVFYQRQYIDSAQRFDEALRLTPEHIAALDMFDALANDPTLHFRMRLRPGDMQFVYNHAQLHDRTGFTDWSEPGKRRHLLRLWLSLPGDRTLPECFKERYGDITPGQRGGIICAGTALNAPLDA